MDDILKTNKEYIEDFLNTIENEFNINCINRRYNNGYFIIEYGKNSVCKFNIKEIPEFTFGIWMSTNVNLNYYDGSYKNSKLILFTQPTINIDKFKPSRSSFCLPIERYLESDIDGKEYYTWYLTEVELMLKALRKNKIKSFYKADSSSWDFYDEISYLKALKYYINSYYIYYKDIIEKRYKRNKLTKLIKNKFKKFKNVKAILYLSENWSPELNLIFCINENIDDKENNKLTKLDEWIDKHYFMDISSPLRRRSLR